MSHDNPPRFTVSEDRVAAALPFVQECYPKATQDIVRKVLTGAFPGMDAVLRRWDDDTIRRYQTRLDQTNPETLGAMANDMITALSGIPPLSPYERRARDLLGIKPDSTGEGDAPAPRERPGAGEPGGSDCRSQETTGR